MNAQFSKTLAVAAALATVAIGCGSDDDDNAGGGASKPRAPEAVSALPKLVGDYRRTMTEADLARTERFRDEGGPHQQRPEPGPLALTLSNGTLKFVDLKADVTISQDFSATSDGAFRIGAYQRPEQGSFCGPDVPQTASYTWRLSGDVLTLTASEDPCADRDSSLGGEWKRR